MTESEARERWCPFARMCATGEPTWNRVSMLNELHDNDPKCIASKCMAWRWGDSKAGYGEPGSLQGYCGLAGKP